MSTAPAGFSESPKRGERRRTAPSRDEVTIVAALGVVGFAFTGVAAVVVVAVDEAPAGWWVVVGLATFLWVVTTTVFVHLAIRRRAFIQSALELAARLEDPKDIVGDRLQAFAIDLRDHALSSGEVTVASRLDAAIERQYRRESGSA